MSKYLSTLGYKEYQLNLSVSERTDTANHDQLSLKSVLSDLYLLFAVMMYKMHTYNGNANKSYSDQNSQALHTIRVHFA